MPAVTVNGRRVRYEMTGDGFPLLLVPDRNGTIHDWAPAMPLLGELCRVIAYEYEQSAPAGTPSAQLPLLERVADLHAVFAALAVERAYVAGVAAGGLTALAYALRAPQRLEGLTLISVTTTDGELAKSLQDLTTPTLLVAGEEAAEHRAWATQLARQCARASTEVIARSNKAPHREQPLQLGHIVLRFLLQCERQRNLVRGASFLL